MGLHLQSVHFRSDGNVNNTEYFKNCLHTRLDGKRETYAQVSVTDGTSPACVVHTHLTRREQQAG